MIAKSTIMYLWPFVAGSLMAHSNIDDVLFWVVAISFPLIHFWFEEKWVTFK